MIGFEKPLCSQKRSGLLASAVLILLSLFFSSTLFAANDLDSSVQNKIFSSKNRYQPYFEAGGIKYFNQKSTAAGIYDLFIPLLQNDDQLLFTDLRIFDRSGSSFEGNVHLGYRKLYSDTNQMFGVYGAFDRKKSDEQNIFNQLTLGFEYWRNKFFIGGNIYQPIGKRIRPTKDITSHIEETDDKNITTFQVTDRYYEQTLPGIDAELGYAITDNLTSYVGGYYFAAKDSNTIIGPKIRLVYDYRQPVGRILGVLDGVSIEAGFQHDKPRGNTAYIGVKLKVGLTNFKKNSNLFGFARHMVESVRRDVDIVMAEKKTPERIEKIFKGIRPIIPESIILRLIPRPIIPDKKSSGEGNSNSGQSPPNSPPAGDNTSSDGAGDSGGESSSDKDDEAGSSGAGNSESSSTDHKKQEQQQQQQPEPEPAAAPPAPSHTPPLLSPQIGEINQAGAGVSDNIHLALLPSATQAEAAHQVGNIEENNQNVDVSKDTKSIKPKLDQTSASAESIPKSLPESQLESSTSIVYSETKEQQLVSWLIANEILNQHLRQLMILNNDHRDNSKAIPTPWKTPLVDAQLKNSNKDPTAIINRPSYDQFQDKSKQLSIAAGNDILSSGVTYVTDLYYNISEGSGIQRLQVSFDDDRLLLQTNAQKRLVLGDYRWYLDPAFFRCLIGCYLMSQNNVQLLDPVSIDSQKRCYYWLDSASRLFICCYLCLPQNSLVPYINDQIRVDQNMGESENSWYIWWFDHSEIHKPLSWIADKAAKDSFEKVFGKGAWLEWSGALSGKFLRTTIGGKTESSKYLKETIYISLRTLLKYSGKRFLGVVGYGVIINLDVRTLVTIAPMPGILDKEALKYIVSQFGIMNKKTLQTMSFMWGAAVIAKSISEISALYFSEDKDELVPAIVRTAVHSLIYIPCSVLTSFVGDWVCFISAEVIAERAKGMTKKGVSNFYQPFILTSEIVFFAFGGVQMKLAVVALETLPSLCNFMLPQTCARIANITNNRLTEPAKKIWNGFVNLPCVSVVTNTTQEAYNGFVNLSYVLASEVKNTTQEAWNGFVSLPCVLAVTNTTQEAYNGFVNLSYVSASAVKNATQKAWKGFVNLPCVSAITNATQEAWKGFVSVLASAATDVAQGILGWLKYLDDLFVWLLPG